MPCDDLRIPAALRGRAQQIIDVTDMACREHLDDEYGLLTKVTSVDCGPDARTGLTARVLREGEKFEVALADLRFAPDSELGVVVAAYRRWQGR
jgi:hypothetical protein